MNGKTGTKNDQPMVSTVTNTHKDDDGGTDGQSPENVKLAAADALYMQALIERIIDHNQTAFSELYGLLLERVFGLALRITRDTQLAEEATEDAFWQVWRQAPRFDAQRGNVVAWVMTIARSRALDALRRVDAVECEALAETHFLEGDDPHDLLAAIEESSHLHTALEQLEPLPRQLLALAFFRGLSHDEIALSMALPLGTVKSHIRRALLSLKHTLAIAVDTGL